MSDLARQSFTVTRHAYDARADQRRRTIHMSMTHVSIERVVGGVKMTVAVPVGSYRAVVIRARAPSGSSTVTLSHRDRDLDVVLAVGEAAEAAIVAKAWAAVLEKTIVVEAGVTIRPVQAHRKQAAKPSRRSSFSRRRKPGLPARMMRIFSGESEIIARN